MSEVARENVELVRKTIEALDHAFASYWRRPEPRSIAKGVEAGDWPEWIEALDNLHPEHEWQTVFLGSTAHGRMAVARIWDDYLRWASDYRASLEEVEDVGDDRVFFVIALTGRDKTTGREVHSRLYDVATIRDGRIARLAEYTSREEAMEAVAAGAGEQA